MRFSDLIILWYQENKRDLPWRHTNDPYRIWISEIILQQTRVEQGLAYYQRFLERFPDIRSLANAEEEEVMKIWQGLGYYSRARNMHHSARTIIHESHAEFPASYEELKKMKGIGDYSASAISSIVSGEPHPVVDGNVLRVIARFKGIREPVNNTAARKKIKEILAGYIDHEQAGNFNQAVMELGALVCKPKQPLCDKCPLSSDCVAFNQDLVSQLPVLAKSASSKTRYFNYLIILSKSGQENYIWLKKRTGNDIWKNLYDFPLVETEKTCSTEELVNDPQWKKITGYHQVIIYPGLHPARHVLTHRVLMVKFICISCDDFSHPEFIKVHLQEFHKYPVPRLIENILKKVALRPGIFFNFPD